MKIRKTILLAAIALCLCSGCSKKETEPEIERQKDKTTISLSWWGSEARQEYTMEAIKNFEERNPTIRVQLKYGSWNGFPDRMDAEIAAHTEADIMQINYSWLYKYSPNGDRFYDLRKLSSFVNLSNYDETVLELGTVNGVLNAVPIALNTPIFYWNRTLYGQYGLKPPTEWEDLFEAAEVMSKDGIYPLGAAPRFIWFMCAAYVEQQTGRRILGEGAKLTFTEEDLQAMVDFYGRLVEEKVIPPAGFFDRLMLSDGECAGALAWISDADSFCNEAMENGYAIEVGDYLTSPQAKRLGWYVKPASLYAVSKDTQHSKEVGLLLNYLLNSENMSKLQKLEKGVPISNAARNTLQKNDLLQGLQYDGYTKMNESMDKLDLINMYFEDDALVNAFTEAADTARQQPTSAKNVTKELYAQLQELLQTLEADAGT